MSTTAVDRPRILVVEDELMVAIDVEDSLNRLGYDVLAIADTGKQAVELAEQENPDLVVMDIKLRGNIDGIAAADEIRMRWHIPVIFLTALATDEIIDRAKVAQPFGYLTKPFRINELNATIQLALHQHEIASKSCRGREADATADRQSLGQVAHATSDASRRTCAELKALAAHLLKSQEEERRRVARELHDEMGQRAALLEMAAWKLSNLLKGKSREILDTVESISTDVRELGLALGRMSHELHPSIIEAVGLAPAIRNVVEDHQRQGGEIRLNMTALPSMPFEVAVSIYRIVEESLRNVRRHARNSLARVTLTSKERELLLTVEDAGPGFDLKEARAKGNVGLIGMQERARLIGGAMLLTTSPGKGVRIDVRAPLRGAA